MPQGSWRVRKVDAVQVTLAREHKNGYRPDFTQPKAILPVAANHWRKYGMMHIDVSLSCILPRQGSEWCQWRIKEA